MVRCVLKKCFRYKACKKKKNPFAGGRLCKGYEEYANNFQLIDADMVNVAFSKNVDLRDAIIQLYFFDNIRPVSKIREQLACSEQYVYQIIRECKLMLLSNIKKKKVKK